MARAKEEEQQLVFGLDLGVDNTSTPFSVQPSGEAGALVASRNTRLSKTRGVPTKCPGAVLLTDATSRSGNSDCGGIVPCGYASSSLVIRRPQYGSQRLAGSALTGANVTRNYWPADIDRAGPVPGAGAFHQPAIALNDGQIWFAHCVFTGTTTAIELAVLGADGELIASPQSVVFLSGLTVGDALTVWVGLTAHGSNGVRLWYRDTGSNALKVVTVVVSGGTVTVSGSATTVITSAGSSENTWDVCRVDDTYAYAISLAASAVTDVSMIKVDVTSNTVTFTDTLAGVGTATSSRLAIASGAMSGDTYVAATVALVGGTCTLFMRNSARAIVHTITGQMTYGDPFVGFYRQGATEYVVYGCSDNVGAITTSFADTAGTRIQFRALDAAGGLANTITLPWVRIGSHMRAYEPEAGEMYPVFASVPFWNKTNTPTDDEYVLDPARNVYLIENSSAATVIGRFALDRCDEVEHSIDASLHNSACLAVSGQKIATTYLKFLESYAESSTGFPINFVEMDMSPRQPRTTIAADGSTLIAGALPAIWDGSTVSEMCPLQQPRITAAGSGGSGDTIPAGTYYLIAFLQWRSATGTLHRGMPSPIYTLVTGAPDKWVIQASAPAIALRSNYQMVICISESGDVADTIMHEQKIAITSQTSFVLTYSNVPQPTALAYNPAAYTTGDATEALPSQQPPAFYDVAIVGNRAWAILGERQNEIWYSKPKEEGIGYEWSSDQTITLPPVAKKARAVVEFSGSPAFLAQGGVFVITGQGPDATLDNPDAFNSPEQISDLSCDSRESVVRTPAGVMFVSGERFAMLGAGGAQQIANIDASAFNVVSSALLRESQEVIWLTDGDEHPVFNYSLGRWTHWTTDAIPSVTAAALDPSSGDIAIVDESMDPYRVDTDAVSTSAQVSFYSGQIVLGLPQDDNVVHAIIVHAVWAGSHGLSVTLDSDYGQSDSRTVAIASATIDQCTVNNQYSLEITTGNVSMRGLKISILETDAVGNAFQPLSVSIVFAKNPTTKRDAIFDVGRV